MSCGRAPEPEPEEPETVHYETIEEAHAALTDRFIDRAGVAGTAIGACDGNPCLKVYVVGTDAPIATEIPDAFGGFVVQVEVSGEIRPLGTSDS